MCRLESWNLCARASLNWRTSNWDCFLRKRYAIYRLCTTVQLRKKKLLGCPQKEFSYEYWTWQHWKYSHHSNLIGAYSFFPSQSIFKFDHCLCVLAGMPSTPTTRGRDGFACGTRDRHRSNHYCRRRKLVVSEGRIYMYLRARAPH